MTHEGTQEKTCSRCSYVGLGWQFEEHHPDRKEQPDLTVTLCIPCHQKLHADEKAARREAQKPIHVRLSAEEKAWWTEAAGDVPLSRWIRRVCNNEVQQRAEQEIGVGVAHEPALGKENYDEHGRARVQVTPDFKK
jgi:hypothetical protein